MRLQAFAGEWRIERTIEDALLVRSGVFTGRAVFTSMSDGLAYHEEGELQLGDSLRCTASRRYIWREAGGNAIELRFSDGRFFHRFTSGEPAPSAAHDCPPDSYRVRYDFRAWPVWTAAWRVTGPRKDYAMVSAFRRAGQA